MLSPARRLLGPLVIVVILALGIIRPVAAAPIETPTPPPTGGPTTAATPTATVTPGGPTPTPTPRGGIPQGQISPTPGLGWVESPVVTELGRNSERSRELLSWAFSHPPIYRHPALGEMWTISRNIAYFFVVFTIVMFAIGFVLAQRRGVPITANIVSILLKIAAVLLFITFSYQLIVIILELSELLMRFFINQVGGKDLFNIFFVGGSGGVPNTEKNYTDFFGYLNLGARQVNLEMINTSMMLIRLTNLTYNVMAVLLILRHVILWFLLIVSPFLALLMPFIFIRNTGWIWIGVFLQWVFYGPLFALFLVALTKIWVAGIPYPFDFGRTPRLAATGVDTCAVTPFKTSINILYGGPAQTLGVCNSANYIDTYAEYVIALIMLWAVTFLPWLLLRIFRDYCCDILAQNQAILVQILDRLRSFGSPPPSPPPPTPTSTTGVAAELAFRHGVTVPQATTLTKITEIERNIEKVRTEDIVSAMNLSVSTIQDIARLDINEKQQAERRANLDSLRNPATITDREARDRYSSIRNELLSRAAKGDVVARRVVAAAEQRASEMTRAGVMARPVTTPEVAQKSGVSEQQVRSVLAVVPAMGIPSAQHIKDAAVKANVTVGKVEEILAVARPGLPKKAVVGVPGRPPQTKPVTTAVPTVTVDDYEEVKNMWLNHYRSSDVPISDRIKTREQWVKEDVGKINNIINLLTATDAQLRQQAMTEASNILPLLLLGGFSDAEAIAYLKAKLAAAQQVQSELEVAAKAKAEAKKDEGELVEVGEKKEAEKEKELKLEQALEQEAPQEEKEAAGKKPPTEGEAKEKATSGETTQADSATSTTPAKSTDTSKNPS